MSTSTKKLNAKLKLNEVNHRQHKKEIEICKHLALDAIGHEQKILAENLSRLQLEKEYHQRNKFVNVTSDSELAHCDMESIPSSAASLRRTKSYQFNRQSSFGSRAKSPARRRSSTDPIPPEKLTVSFSDKNTTRRVSKDMDDALLPVYIDSGAIISPPIIHSRRGPCQENPDWLGSPDAIQSIRRGRKTVSEQRLLKVLRTPDLTPSRSPLSSQASFVGSDIESRIESRCSSSTQKRALRRTNSDRPVNKDEALRKLRTMSLKEKCEKL